MFKLFKYFKGKTFGVLASAVLLIFLSSLFHIIQPIFVNWCISIVGAINNPAAAGEPGHGHPGGHRLRQRARPEGIHAGQTHPAAGKHRD